MHDGAIIAFIMSDFLDMFKRLGKTTELMNAVVNASYFPLRACVVVER